MKKSQAAMEFLLTYGWAIMVVLVAISALAYFGVFNKPYFTRSYCTLPAGLTCLDHSYSHGKFTFVMKNNLGNKIIVETVSAAGDCLPINVYEPLDNDQTIKITISCIKFADPIDISYKNINTGLSHSINGEGSASGEDANSYGELLHSGTPTTNPTYCTNANNNGLCGILDKFGEDHNFGSNYKTRCCTDYGLCC